VGVAFAQVFGLDELPDWQPRYNIAPTQMVPVIRQRDGNDLEWALLKWGLVPSWAADLSTAVPLINARAETVAVKPVFRSAFRKRRCVLPAGGFFEWKTVAGKKQGQLFSRRDGEVFAFAGLWESWTRHDHRIESVTILTTQANDLVGQVHDRMPVILEQQAARVWLDPTVNAVDVLQSLLRPCPPDELLCCPVGPAVNNVRSEGPQCIAPAVPSQRMLF
jgi:putative SOS response-associated peptidase YedK